MKELEKTYNPADIEDRLYQKWLDNKYFHADAERGRQRGQEAVHDRNAAAKYYRTASYGTCAGQHHAGYPDPLQENAGL